MPPTQHEPRRISYLDGLRGLSIMPVLLGHTYSPDSIPWFLSVFFSGSTGVQVFFVLSGIIITRLLLEEKLASGTIRQRAFFARRLAKLLPVLWCFVAVLMASGLSPETSWLDALKAVTLTTGFLASSSFALGHIWSLTVEETFYVTWAPAAARLPKARLSLLAAFVAVLAVLVRGLNIAATSNNFHAHFQWWPTIPVVEHLDVIAIGCLAELHRGDLARLFRRVASAPLVLPALAWLVALQAASTRFYLLDLSRLAWINAVLGPTLVAVSTAALCLTLEARGRPASRSLFEVRPLVSLGRASYSIYVVQQAFCVPAESRGDWWIRTPPLCIALAIATGFAAFALIEEPMRRVLVARLGIARNPTLTPRPDRS